MANSSSNNLNLDVELTKTVESWMQPASTPEDTPGLRPQPSHRVDGGYHAWATLVGGFFVAVVTFGYVNAFGVYQDVYTRAGAASPSAISWIGSTQLFLLLAMGLPGGILLDKGHFRVTLAAGSLLYAFSLFMVSIADSSKYYQIYLSQGLGMGIGAGLIYVPCVAVQGHHWHSRRALAMGVVVSGSSIGGVIFPIMLNQLFQTTAGFEWGVRASAFVVLALLLASNFLMTSHPVVRSPDAPKPDMKGIITDIPYLLANFSTLVIDWGLFFPYFYLQLYAIEHGVNPEIAFYTLAVMNAAAVFGRVVPNYFADKYGPFNTVLPVTFACAVLLFALFGITTLAGTVVFALLFGFFSGAYLSLCAPCVASLARNPSEIGARFGPAYLITSFGALTGTPITGALVGDNFTWWKNTLFCGLVSVVSLGMLIVARNMIAARKGTHFV
ncbi:MFS general substrate transporter [Earliella scabrosa]|nr:MFS general substrate transporter [Earliella scabrosa]